MRRVRYLPTDVFFVFPSYRKTIYRAENPSRISNSLQVDERFLYFSKPPGHDQGNTLVIVILLSDCLQYSNSAINPVLYAFLSDNFKKSFRKACHCDKREVTGQGHNQDCSATTRSVNKAERSSDAIVENQMFM